MEETTLSKKNESLSKGKYFGLLLFHSCVRGGALYFAIFIMLLLSMLGVLLLSFFHLKFKEDTLFYENSELTDNLNSAVAYLSVNPEEVKPGGQIERDLFNDSVSIVNIKAERWGLLRKITAEACWKNLHKTKIVLMAEKAKQRPALWMPNRNQFISLVGNSFIMGDCYLSRLGVRKGNAEGRNFEGPFLHKGELFLSKEELPEINDNLLSYISLYQQGNFQKSDSLCYYEDMETGERVAQSFSQKTLFVQSAGKLVLDRDSFEDNIILYSTDTIEVWPSAQLVNILLMGKVIIFRKGFKGVLQAFAREKLLVGDNCNIAYPGFLMCNGDSASIEIGEAAKVNGGVICRSGSGEKSSLIIGKGAQIIGKVYVNGNCRFEGSITGSLYCDRFVKKTDRAFYENFLIDCSINENELPDEYASFCITDSIYELKTVKECN